MGSLVTNPGLRALRRGAKTVEELERNVAEVLGSFFPVPLTYTPSLTNVTNIADSTPRECQYLKIANMVVVSGTVDIDPTANGAASEIGISLPISTTFTNSGDCAGVAAASAVAGLSGRVTGDTTNHRAMLNWVAQAENANRSWSFIFMYEVK